MKKCTRLMDKYKKPDSIKIRTRNRSCPAAVPLSPSFDALQIFHIKIPNPRNAVVLVPLNHSALNWN